MSALYLFDTNILVHLVRDDATGQHVRSKYSPFLTEPRPFICVVTDGELRSLALQWSWGDRKIDQMGYMLGFFRKVSIERPDVMQAYATIDFHSKSRGVPMGKNDLWIAATSYLTSSRLVTTDDDFDHLDSVFFSVDKIEFDNGK